MKRIVSIALLCLPVIAAGQSTLSNCVNTTTGASRYVNSAANCKAGEAFVQWNVQGATGPAGASGPAGSSGPTGAAGATGPAGMGLTNVLVIPSTGNPNADGATLYAALLTAAANSATAANPYVIQLDAGSYNPNAIVLPPYVSLVGSGMLSTIVTTSTVVANQPGGSSDQTISNLTLAFSPFGGSLRVSVGGNFHLDRVLLAGPLTASGTCALCGSPNPLMRFTITDSILQSDATFSLPIGTLLISVIGTEVNLVTAVPAFTLVCQADHNSSGQVLTQSVSQSPTSIRNICS